MIEIVPELLIGKGMKRTCYQHPSDSTKCIKVFHDTPKIQKSIQRRMFREVMETRRLKLIKPQFIIPSYYGEVQTSHGRGFVFDYITDNGKPLPTIYYYLKRKPHKINEVRESLYEKLMIRPVVATEIHTNNLLVIDKGENLEYAIVDGLEDTHFFKIYSIFPHLARKKLREKWRSTKIQLDAIEAGDLMHPSFASIHQNA